MVDAERVDYEIDDRDAHVHYDWDSTRDPVRTVESGARLRFTCRDALDGAVGDETAPEDLYDELAMGHALTGPVAVEDARPGDVLAVEIERVDHHGWGYTFVRPGEFEQGLLPEAFADPALHVWDLEGDTGYFVDDIEVPLAPFPGVVGLAPDEPEPCSTTPPRRVGGNMDVKHLVAGATLYLPVEVAGGLLSIGDGHAAQGDGEVCLTAIEAPVSVTARVTLRSDMAIDGPQFETPASSVAVDSERLYATSGVAAGFETAIKEAVSSMVDHLTNRRGLSPEEAYMLCSVAGDLKINEVVNEPHYVVSAYLPTGIFPD